MFQKPLSVDDEGDWIQTGEAEWLPTFVKGSGAIFENQTFFRVSKLAVRACS